MNKPSSQTALPGHNAARPLTTGKRWLTGRILALEFVGFQLVLFIIWLDEFFNLESRLRGMPPKGISWFHFLLESGAVFVLMVAVMAGTFWLLRWIKQLESFVVVCAWCNKVRYGGQWISFGRFLEEHHGSETSHGMCPACFEKATQKGPGT